jgi:hypothetical protein
MKRLSFWLILALLTALAAPVALSQTIASSASACAQSPPADVAAAGYSTLVSCSDWTAAIPNSLGTGLPGVAACSSSSCPSGNWLDCPSGTSPSSPWHQGAVWVGETGGGWTNYACNLISQVTDSGGGGNLALDMSYNPSTFSPNQTVNGQVIGMVDTISGGTGLPWGRYFEWQERFQTNPTAYTASAHCCGPWSANATTGANGFALNFLEVFPFAGQSTISFNTGGGGTVSSTPNTTSQFGVYHKYAVLATASIGSQGGCPSGYSNGCGVACFFLDGVLTGAGGMQSDGQCAIYGWDASTFNGRYETIVWGPDGGILTSTTVDPSCNCDTINTQWNAPITAITDCGGAICITAPQTADVVGAADTSDGVVYPVYISGTGTSVDGYHANGVTSTSGGVGSTCPPYWSGQPCYPGPTWKLVGSSWPSGGISYSGSGGVFDPVTSFDVYYKYIKIVSCASWSTTMCAQGTIVTSDLNHRYEGHDYSYAEQQKHPLGRLVAHAPSPNEPKVALNAKRLDKGAGMGRMLGTLGTAHRFDVGGPLGVHPGVANRRGGDSPAGGRSRAVADPGGVVQSWLSFLGDASQTD